MFFKGANIYNKTCESAKENSGYGYVDENGNVKQIDPRFYTGGAYDDTELRSRLSAIEGKETGWNAKYSKPPAGIPKTDLASGVKESIEKADTAVQPETGKGLFSGNYSDLSGKPAIPNDCNLEYNQTTEELIWTKGKSEVE